jgi:hypothetical protein
MAGGVVFAFNSPARAQNLILERKAGKVPNSTGSKA